MATTLWPHQLEARAFALPRPASLCGMGMGCGKSATATSLADDWNPSRTLILCPTSVRAVWNRELRKHSQRELDITILDSGSVRKRTERAAAAYDKEGTNLALVVNYEAAWRSPMRELLLSRRWGLVIADESQRIMRDSRTSRFARELHDVADRRLCLSGTPLTNDPVTVFGQCRFLDPSVFGESLEIFKILYENKYSLGLRKALAKARRRGDWRMNTGLFHPPEDETCGICNRDDYMEKLSRIAFRVENAVLNLPPLTIEKRTFTLSPRARSLYTAAEDGRLDEIETGVWPSIRGSFSVTMRCQQITSGFLPTKEGKIERVDNGKEECLRDLLDGAGGEPVVVFCRFTEDLLSVERIAGELGLRYGEISQRRKDGIDDMATMPSHLNCVGVQEAAGGAGIDLSRARIGIDYSPSWSLANFKQKLARIHRPPQSQPVIVYRLSAENSIDEDIDLALEERDSIIAMAWARLADQVHLEAGSIARYSSAS